jgi:hypothetical protein
MIPIINLRKAFPYWLRTLDASVGLSTMIKTIPRNLSPKSSDSKLLMVSSTSFNSALASSILIGAFPQIFP